MRDRLHRPGAGIARARIDGKRRAMMIGAIAAGATSQAARASLRLPIEGNLPSLAGATGWLNSPPLTPAALRGKVVLVDVWTYTCINWLRTLPYLRAWAEKYEGRNLVVIGVHSPEFPFEQDSDNVRRAVQEMRIGYPIAVDSGHAIWRALDNQYWPALYVVDAQGRIRHHRFGEGEYDRSERVVQQLLAEAGVGGVDHDLVSVEPTGAEVAADWNNLRSPENYVGYARTEGFASPGGAVRDRRGRYAVPSRLPLDGWALSGDWTIRSDVAVVQAAGGRIAYRFHARDVHLVMGPAARGNPARFRIRLDGQPPGAAHGGDVDEQGAGVVREPRLHQLVRQRDRIVDRTFEIEFVDPGVEVYAFTFG